MLKAYWFVCNVVIDQGFKAIYKYSHKLCSPPTCGGGNGIFRMTDEIKTGLSTTFAPPPIQASIFHSSSQDALTLRLLRLVFSGGLSLLWLHIPGKGKEKTKTNAFSVLMLVRLMSSVISPEGRIWFPKILWLPSQQLHHFWVHQLSLSLTLFVFTFNQTKVDLMLVFTKKLKSSIS